MSIRHVNLAVILKNRQGFLDAVSEDAIVQFLIFRSGVISAKVQSLLDMQITRVNMKHVATAFGKALKGYFVFDCVRIHVSQIIRKFVTVNGFLKNF